MSWTTSNIFQATITDALSLGTTTKMKLGSDGFKAALYGTSITPDRNVTNTLSAYAAATSQWITGNEIISGTGGWPAGGIALTTVTINSATANTVFFTAANTVSSTGGASLAAVFGCLIYDTTATTVTNQGVCYNYFGGSNSVTSGTFTIAYAANPSGIFNITV